ncbi:kinase-like protein, partial [Rhizodiscina lignyota]
IQEELETKWILNLSMHFRDKSDREKFFITFIDEPNKWRRVTVSCDYRDCQSDSLEADLKTLYYQRDKSGKIYEAIRDSLTDIQFLETVTNLKLKTDDGRLHVHVTEDVNEIIPYPPVSFLPYIHCPHYRESEVNFESHLSGFVYKVSIRGKSYIKKEIPGPEAVDEFLYEINALSGLSHSDHIIPFEGIVVDEAQEVVTGLVISYAEGGALVDLLYDLRGTSSLPWSRRERWARQIVQGLSDIHEAGFVQGDFTLSNIVIDSNDNAQIIDINRRGCPVGWEPPEMSKMIEAGQKISMYIGTKTDLFQLGMVLWALVEEQDEPERVERPLETSAKWDTNGIPAYYRNAFELCYDDDPGKRVSAKEILKMF